MYTQNEILFPHYAIESLRDTRGPQWRAFVDHIVSLPETNEAPLAFMLLMIRLNNCLECETDSYRAMRGCGPCSAQTIRRFKGNDADLIQLYEKALEDVRGQIMVVNTAISDQEFV